MRLSLVSTLATCGFCLAAFACAADAHAYCRTTTAMLPGPSLDASRDGICWTQGTPLAWSPNQAIGYVLSSDASSQVSFADFERITQLSFNAWNTATCPKGLLSVQAFYAGTVDAATIANDCGLDASPCDVSFHDTIHAITFRDDDSGGVTDVNNTLALTIVTYGVNSGTIYDADIEIYSSTTSTPPHYLTTVEPPVMPIAPNTYDLQAILTHEAGHFLGLAHAPDSASIMYAFYKPGSIELTQDDLDGICAIYPPVAPTSPHSGCALESAPVPSSAALLGGAMGFVAIALFRARRKRSE